jgi:hypothetical protein
MSQAEFAAEFLGLHHKLKLGHLTNVEEARWRELRECLNRSAPVGAGAADPMEWDPEIESGLSEQQANPAPS